jgi:HSF-type DNA-binding
MASSTREPTEHQPSGEGSNLYQDHSLSVPLLGESAIEDPDSQRFPPRLFRLLDRAEEEGFNHVISWQLHGRCFAVHGQEAFKRMLPVLMPGMTQWKSFQRQLRVWGFTRLTEGRDSNGYYHELFLRYRPHLLCRMRRHSHARDRDNEPTMPNFYSMPFLTPLRSAARGNEGVLLRATPTLGPRPTTSAPLDSSVSISMSGHSDGVALNLLGASRASLVRDRVPRWSAAGVNDNLAGNTAHQPDSMMRREELWSGFDDHDVDLAQVEPMPLPPVVTRVGETVVHSHTPIPVAQHPGFVQIGPREFLFQGQGVDESEHEALTGSLHMGSHHSSSENAV